MKMRVITRGWIDLSAEEKIIDELNNKGLLENIEPYALEWENAIDVKPW